MESGRFGDFEGRQAKNEKSLSSLTTLLVIWGIYCIADLIAVIGLLAFLLSRFTTDQLAGPLRQIAPHLSPQYVLITAILGTVAGIVIIAVNAVAAFCAFRLIRQRTKRKIACYWMLALLAQVPFGLLIAIYGIQLLNRKDIQMMFDAPPAMPQPDQWTMPGL